MKTIALRFGEHFAPEIGTIAAHQQVLDELGFVWYGKLGSTVSKKIIEELLKNENPKILLISSGKADRYWAYINGISSEKPNFTHFPSYYRELGNKMKTWFRIIRIEKADKNIMTKCVVRSSGTTLSEASKHSMSPYFIIDAPD